MKYVQFNTLSIKNFFSIGKEPIIIEFKPGITTITGTNHDKGDRQNGVGKTTICNAFYFAIFGKLLDNELKKELAINNITNKTAETIISFDIDGDSYKIIRTIGPSKCYLFKNSVDITLDSIKNTDAYILDLINASPEVFQNCVIMTANNSTPFMAKSKVEKRKFIESIFNIEIFSKMLGYAREDYNSHKKIHDIEYAKYHQLLESEENIKNRIDKADAEKQNKINVIDQKIKDYNTSKNKYETFLAVDYTTQLTDIQQKTAVLEKNITEKSLLISKIKEKLWENEQSTKTLRSKISKVKTDKDTCEMCLRAIADHDKKDIEEEVRKISAEIDEFNTKIKKLNTLLSSTSKEHTDLSKEKEELNIKIRSIENAIERKKDITERLHDTNTIIASLQDEKNNIKVDELSLLLEDTILKKNKLKSTVDEEQNNLSLLDVAKYALSEEGVKSFIVHKILDMFNGIIMQYVKKLDGVGLVYFNEFFEEQIINNKGKQCSYYNFSGAERKVIDLACWFAFKDIRRLQGNVTYNVSFYDELFDSSIDGKGLSFVVDVLKQHQNEYKESIMIISHRKENITISDRVINLQKKKDITTLVDIVES